jgi:monofunctional biosynthetic peptidoglycan transglycosylase
MNDETQAPHPQRPKGLIQRTLRFFLRALVILFIFSLGITILYRFVPVPYTPLMFWRSIASIFSEEKFVGIDKKWVPIEKISKSMQQSVIKSEDYKFYQHHGFDFDAIEKAMQYNKTHKKKKGASTISQQTAKNVFLWPSRSWIRKGMEAYFTVLIEMFWPKKRILECYLNVIEFGKGVYGVEAASQKFFKHPASKLNSAEAALMAAVLPNPIRFRVDKPSHYIISRQRKIMGRRAPPIEIAAIKPVETPEEKSKAFFSLKFDSEYDEENKQDIKEKGAEAPQEISTDNSEDLNND